MKEVVKKADIKVQICAFLLIVSSFFLVCNSSVFADELKPEIQAVLTSGDTARAVQMLNNDISVDKSYYLNYYTLGRIYFQREEFAKAKEQFALAVEHKGKDWSSQYYFGLSYLKLNMLDSAATIMDDGRKKAKGDSHIFENGYGLVMMAKKNYQEADRAFRKALLTEPKNIEYRLNLGDANFYQGVPSLAIAEYEQAIKDNEGSMEVYYHWAEACIEMKDYNCALEKLGMVLAKDSTHASAWLRAGGIYFKAAMSSRSREERLGRFKATIDAYEHAITLSGVHADSVNVRAFYEIGLAYLQIFEFDSARVRFNQVLSIPYEPRDIYFNYGKALWGLKEYDKSAEMLNKHVELMKQPNAPETKASEAELYQLLGDGNFYRKPPDFVSAVDSYKKSLEKDSTQKRVIYNIAIAYQSVKSYDQALDYYEKRIAMGVDSATCGIYKNAAYCALNQASDPSGGEDDDGLDDQPVEAAPAEPRDYIKLAGDYFDKYLECVPGDTGVLVRAGSVFLYQLKQCDKGVKYFTDLLALTPNNCEAQKGLGFAYFGGLCSKNYGKAITYLTGAYNCSAEMRKDVDLALWIAQAYHLQAADKSAAKQDPKNEFKNANEWYSKVLALQPANSIAKKGFDDTRFEF